MAEIAAQSSIELHRTAGTKNNPPEYSWTVKLYTRPGEYAEDFSHFRPATDTDDAVMVMDTPLGKGVPVNVAEQLITQHQRIDAEMLRRFGPKDQLAAITEAFEAGRQKERADLIDFLQDHDESLTLESLLEKVKAIHNA